jgi:hypothetical protein
MEIRVIGTVDKDDDLDERVTFTEDMDDPIENFLRPNDQLMYDEIIDVDAWPGTFPMERTLKVQF